ncbi:MAG: hypothetical protein ABI216_22050 [Devosia sp.]
MATLGIVIAVTALIAFGIGWKVEGWRMSGKVAQAEKVADGLKLENDVLRSANDKAATDIQSVRASVAGIEQAARDHKKAASEAIEQANEVVADRMITIARIRAKPLVASDQQCETIIDEQMEYVKTRLH